MADSIIAFSAKPIFVPNCPQFKYIEIKKCLSKNVYAPMYNETEIIWDGKFPHIFH